MSSFAISELTKRAIFAHPILGAKIEMHENDETDFYDVLSYLVGYFEADFAQCFPDFFLRSASFYGDRLFGQFYFG